MAVAPAQPPRPPSEEAFIRVAGVGKTYAGKGGRGLKALHDVSFDVGRRQFISILGASGCGKSTLLMMIAGLEQISAGQIIIAGQVAGRPRRDVGVIFQDATLLPWKTAIENVLLPIEIFGLKKEQYRERAEALLGLVGLGHAMDKRPRELSGGMRQRVSICRALIHEPSVLLMDEPFSALDAITRDDLNVELLRIWDRYHQTALFVTHSIREAAFLSDRVIVLGDRPGRVLADMTMPFPRPRDLSIGETIEFNRICAELRHHVATGHAEASAAVSTTTGAAT
ncbi:MAG: ABC transporter ATP-binding protein [Proteobacteria bacterium]|nr:ABC transporter ATP-binding protein [Pseudomonadota bacterium]